MKQVFPQAVPRSAVGRVRPSPPDPVRRVRPLPQHEPKSVEDDPGAADRVRAIMASPSYRRTDDDVEFLDRNEMRGVRLQMDYDKPEILLADHGVTETVVIFGSTRIPEPAAAVREVERLRDDLLRSGGDPLLGKRLVVAERILVKSRYYDVARDLGRLVASADGRRRIVVTGGGPGIMEGANRGAFDVKAKTIGLNISLPHEQFPNPYITPELCFNFRYFAVRKMHFLLRAKALVAFPGGYGTFDELFEVLTLVQTRTMPPIPIVLVGEEFWRGAVDFGFLADEGVIDPEDLDLFWFAETAQEVWDGIVAWHAEYGDPSFGGGRVDAG